MRILLLIMTMTLPLTSRATLQMPNIFSDHMVLQCERLVPVWGRTDPGAEVHVRFGECEVSGRADTDGAWQLMLPPQDPSFEPRKMEVASAGATLLFSDILVGEVWLCSGQSNMEWRTDNALDADIERLAADHPGIRLYHVSRIVSETPRFSDAAIWEVCDPNAIAAFSAVGYYFGRDLRQVLDRPIGLINASWGGTPAIAWTREGTFTRHPLLQQRNEEWNQLVDSYPERRARWQNEFDAFMAQSEIVIEHVDPGLAEASRDWMNPDFDDLSWKHAFVPVTFSRLIGDVDGSVWFRRTIDLPQEMRGEMLQLDLGVLDDFDTTWVNGVPVGGLADPALQPWNQSRSYAIGPELTQTDRLVIAVRIFDRAGDGGFMSGPSTLSLRGSNQHIQLAGQWKWKEETIYPPAVGPWMLNAIDGAPKEPGGDPASAHRPASLANGMLAPVAPYAIRGAIWYQGEADAGWEPGQYGERLRVMIEDWREWWNIDDLHFGIVQLANFLQPDEGVADDPWPHLRESQRRLACSLPYTGLAVTIDIGEAPDIHPRNKQTVGRRLARWALADVYDRIALRGGPELETVWFESNCVRLQFRSVGSGLKVLNDWELDGFTLAGEDGTFQTATARIEGKDTVVVCADGIENPQTVRYGWNNNPVQANLGNEERLPASPFEVTREP